MKTEYEIKRDKKIEDKKLMARKKSIKKITKWIIFSVITLSIIGGFTLIVIKAPKVPESDIVARNGIHWHPELSIYIAGKKQVIPADIGLNPVEQPIHTHDATGEIHLEFGGVVHTSDITLGQFFRVWGKDMRSFGTNMKMTVNGKVNTEYENYIMHDGDKIELKFD